MEMKMDYDNYEEDKNMSENLKDYFKPPSRDEIDRQWLQQMCWDSQMDDDEIDEFIEVAIRWKDKSVEREVEEERERIREWLINEDFEGLAERI